MPLPTVTLSTRALTQVLMQQGLSYEVAARAAARLCRDCAATTVSRHETDAKIERAAQILRDEGGYSAELAAAEAARLYGPVPVEPPTLPVSTALSARELARKFARRGVPFEMAQRKAQRVLRGQAAIASAPPPPAPPAPPAVRLSGGEIRRLAIQTAIQLKIPLEVAQRRVSKQLRNGGGGGAPPATPVSTDARVEEAAAIVARTPRSAFSMSEAIERAVGVPHTDMQAGEELADSHPPVALSARELARKFAKEGMPFEQAQRKAQRLVRSQKSGSSR